MIQIYMECGGQSISVACQHVKRHVPAGGLEVLFHQLRFFLGNWFNRLDFNERLTWKLPVCV